MSREGRGLEPGLQQPEEECWNALSSVILLRPIGYGNSPEIVYFVAEKACQSCLSCRHQQYGFVAPFHVAPSALSARGTSRDAWSTPAQGCSASGLISFRESLRVKAKSNGSSRIRIMQNDEEGFRLRLSRFASLGGKRAVAGDIAAGRKKRSRNV